MAVYLSRISQYSIYILNDLLLEIYLRLVFQLKLHLYLIFGSLIYDTISRLATETHFRAANSTNVTKYKCKIVH